MLVKGVSGLCLFVNMSWSPSNVLYFYIHSHDVLGTFSGNEVCIHNEYLIMQKSYFIYSILIYNLISTYTSSYIHGVIWRIAYLILHGYRDASFVVTGGDKLSYENFLHFPCRQSWHRDDGCFSIYTMSIWCFLVPKKRHFIRRCYDIFLYYLSFRSSNLPLKLPDTLKLEQNGPWKKTYFDLNFIEICLRIKIRLTEI